MFNLICRMLKIDPYFPPIRSRNPFKIWWYDRKLRKSYHKKINQILFNPTQEDLKYFDDLKKIPWGPTVGWKARAERGGIKPDKNGNAPSC